MQQQEKLSKILTCLLIIQLCFADQCTFPPKPLGGDFKVLTLFPKKVVEYSCIPGFHLYGEETAECDQAWSNGKKGPLCLVDFGLRKLASSSSNGNDALIPLQGKWTSKHSSSEKCFQTRSEDKTAWWTVDLMQEIDIIAVNLTFAEDQQIPKSMEIRAGNGSDYKGNPLCNWISNGAKPEQRHFFLVDCEKVARFVSVTAIGSHIPLTLCAVNILVSPLKAQSPILCSSESNQSGEFLTFNGECYLRDPKSKLSFNETVNFCDNHGMDVLTNRNLRGYETMVAMENVGKVGRKVIWIGAQMKLRNKWVWTDYHTSEWPWNGQEVEVQPWGLGEPSGEDCVVTDSALQWQWNSVRCVISAHPICESKIQKCPSPDVKAASYITTQIGSAEFLDTGALVTYQCQEGYVLQAGNENRTCLENGIWSGEAPTCMHVDCENILLESNQENVEYVDNRTTYGALAKISCKRGYSPLVTEKYDTLLYQCGLFGWSVLDPKLKCISLQNCDQYTLRDNRVQMDVVIDTDGQVMAYFSCQTGALKGPKNLQCSELFKIDEQQQPFCEELSITANNDMDVKILHFETVNKTNSTSEDDSSTFFQNGGGEKSIISNIALFLVVSQIILN